MLRLINGTAHRLAAAPSVTSSVLRPKSFSPAFVKLSSQSRKSTGWATPAAFFDMKDDRPPAEFAVSPEQKWWSSETTAIVTGGNKGIGWDICRILQSQGLRTVLTARDAQRGQEAVQKLKEATGGSNTEFAQLDISDPQSVEAFAAWAKKELRSVDILVNNAGFAYKGSVFGAEEAWNTMVTNYYGTKAVCEALLPLMHEGSRIVNVCSVAGKQRILKSNDLVKRFQDAKTPEDVSALAERWLQAVRNGSYGKEGFPGSMYGMSKLCEATYTRVLAEQLQSKGITANACCPGYVATDMSSWRGHKHTSEGADTPAFLALLAPAGTTGGWWSDRSSLGF